MYQFDGPAASDSESGQLIFTLVSVSVSLIWTSSARPAITAREKPGGIRVPSLAWPPAAASCALPELTTSISNRPPRSDSATLTGSAGHSAAWVSTALEQ